MTRCRSRSKNLSRDSLVLLLLASLATSCLARKYHEEGGDAEVLNYDQLQKNPVDARWIPAKLVRADQTLDDTRCPVSSASNILQGPRGPVTFLPDGPGARSADWTALNALLDHIASPDYLKVTVINIVRVNGKPYFRYLSNGTQNHPVQTWSSSKPLAFAAMASQLRAQSKQKVGIDGETENTNGDGGFVPIGDLVSIATVYRERVKPYNSNNLGTWAQNVAGRHYSQRLITKWLKRPNEFFSGGYGDDGSGLTGHFRSYAGHTHAAPLSSAGGVVNQISTLTFADFYRRIILHRELSEQDSQEGRSLCDTESMNSLSLPCVTWSDMKTILYGAEPRYTRYFKDRIVGGMMGGMSVLLHKAVSGNNPTQLNDHHGGQWKIFTKVGWGQVAGIPDTRWHGYACLPTFDASGKPTSEGKEFIVSLALLPYEGLTTAKADIIMQKTLKTISDQIRSGNLR